MMHNGYCLDVHEDVGLRTCDASKAAQQFAYDAKTGTLAHGGECLTLV